MTAYEKAHKEYEALLRRDSVLIAFWAFCAGIFFCALATALAPDVERAFNQVASYIEAKRAAND